MAGRGFIITMKMIKKTGGRAARFVLLAAAVLTGMLFHASDAEAAVKLRYNDKTHTYTGKQLNVIYKEKKISSNSYKAMNIALYGYFQKGSEGFLQLQEIHR